MKKILAVLLAVTMLLACAAATAEEPAAAEAPAQSPAQTVYAQLSIDPEVAKSVTAQYGIKEAAPGFADALIAVLNALGVKAVSADGGMQVDLDLNGTGVLSVGGTSSDDGLVIGSSLFPNFLITASQETLTGMLQQYMPAAAGQGGADMTALAASVSAYFQKFFEACTAAVTPGTPEQTEFDVDGVMFDTLTPMAVDSMAIAEAAKTLFSDLLKDEAFLGMMQSVPGFDPDAALKSLDEALSEEHVPDVRVDVYSNSDGSPAVYAVSETTYRGAEEPACRVTVLSPGDGTGAVSVQMFEPGVIVTVDYAATGFMAAYISENEYFAFRAETEGNDTLRLEAYVTETEKPLLSLKITSSAEGQLTLSLDPEGKSAVTLEDLMGGNAAEASAGLTQDIMANLGTLMTNAAGAVPEFSTLMTVLTAPQVETPTEAPEAGEEEPAA